MVVTGDEMRNKQIGRGVIVTVVIQLIALIVFFTKLDARVMSLERTVNGDLYFTSAKGVLLEQKLDFYIGTIDKIESKLDQIENKIDKLKTN